MVDGISRAPFGQEKNTREKMGEKITARVYLLCTAVSSEKYTWYSHVHISVFLLLRLRQHSWYTDDIPASQPKTA